LQHARKLSAREREVRLVGWALGFLFFRQMKGANNLSGSFNEDEVNDVSLA